MTDFMTIVDFFNANGVHYEINYESGLTMLFVNEHMELTFLFRNEESIDWNDMTQQEFEIYFDWDFAEWLEELEEVDEC